MGTRRLSTVTVGLVLPERGDQIGQGIKCQLVKDLSVEAREVEWVFPPGTN